MVAIGPLARQAAKYGVRYGPAAFAAARKGWAKGKPALQGYQLAEKVDGYTATWPTPEGTVTIVVDADRSRVVGAFPRLSAAEQERALETLDREQFQHHTETPFHRARQAATRAVEVARRPRKRN